MPLSAITQTASIHPNSPSLELIRYDTYCRDFPKAEHVQIIVKTGCNVLYDRLPTQLLTSLRCHTDLLLLADCEHTLGPYHVHDVLANVNETVRATHPAFSYYRTLQKYRQSGLDFWLLHAIAHEAAWNLDKYKFIHMLEFTWARRPKRDWYVFIEADTYLVTRNLLLWLDRMDPSQPLYLGSPASFNRELFAHGGSGIVLSREAMSQVLDSDPNIAERYDERAHAEQYGDFMLMKALQEKGIVLQNSWPLLQGEKQTSLPFGPGPDTGVRHWCQPLITLHHMRPADVSTMWNFEQQRDWAAGPLLMNEVYHHFVGDGLLSERDDWDNLSDDLILRAPDVEGPRSIPPEEMTPMGKDAYRSFEHCGRACKEHARCFQYVYDDLQRTCGFSFSYRLGESKLSTTSENRYRSGWLVEKIKKDYTEHSCGEPQWD